ncbi:glycosyltransferase family 4 protein [Martelella radicis]|uniref:Glycosyltransferase involved in cell wall biosynthesis n=1 Tax=Martelella radicis TaxID=1397476 RepID=A0A7W6KJZ6_9HYPH|nr:glycosyltransferase family 4 protein [Martelella radicis]MBB4122729.1 glycosyltransferase involved in cell wall biosynthesis [Martelella radicis]
MRLVFAYPGNLALRTGGYGYDRRLIAALEDEGWQVDLLPLGDGFPDADAVATDRAEAALSALPDGALVMIDGLAFGILDGFAAREGGRLELVALVHHPLALETGLSPERSEILRKSETRALEHARHVVVTSPETARELTAGFAVAPERITVAVPGTDPAPEARGSGGKPHILSIGSLTPRKGHGILVAALKMVEDLDWTATIAGSRDLDPATSKTIERQIGEAGLADRITLSGAVDDTRPLYAGADLFALASRYEGYGMVFAEALACGLPVVACRAGAVPDVVPESAGVLVPVDDAAAFAEALRNFLSNPDLRRLKAAGAREAGARLHDWHETGRTVSKMLKEIA